jgi:hypothetical protein
VLKFWCLLIILLVLNPVYSKDIQTRGLLKSRAGYVFDVVQHYSYETQIYNGGYQDYTESNYEPLLRPHMSFEGELYNNLWGGFSASLEYLYIQTDEVDKYKKFIGPTAAPDLKTTISHFRSHFGWVSPVYYKLRAGAGMRYSFIDMTLKPKSGDPIKESPTDAGVFFKIETDPWVPGIQFSLMTESFKLSGGRIRAGYLLEPIPVAILINVMTSGLSVKPEDCSAEGVATLCRSDFRATTVGLELDWLF